MEAAPVLVCAVLARMDLPPSLIKPADILCVLQQEVMIDKWLPPSLTESAPPPQSHLCLAMRGVTYNIHTRHSGVKPEPHKSKTGPPGPPWPAAPRAPWRRPAVPAARPPPPARAAGAGRRQSAPQRRRSRRCGPAAPPACSDPCAYRGTIRRMLTSAAASPTFHRGIFLPHRP